MELAPDGSRPSPDPAPLSHWSLDHAPEAKDGLESQTDTSVMK